MSTQTKSATIDEGRPLVVGLGASAGGIEALQSFFKALPEDPGSAFVVIMHLAPDHESELAEVLQHVTSLPVRQVKEPLAVETNHVYIIAPGKALVMNGTVLSPTAFEAAHGPRAPIDQFFRSLAEAPVKSAGVLLSGSGSDGAAGLRALEAKGSLTAIQDPEDAAHASMPHAAIELGHTGLVLPAAALGKRIGGHRTMVQSLQSLEEGDAIESDTKDVLREIFNQVRMHTGHDFSQYKYPTMLRRIQRRMQIHQQASLEAYMNFLENEPTEAQKLQKEFLISVSSFFRNPEAFATLGEEVIPELFAGKGAGDTIRIWVPGCATGEEAYTLAMLLLEEASNQRVPAAQIQIFASDIDTRALTKAREGRYPASIAADVPEPYLATYFHRQDSWLRVVKSIRERIIFTPHNLLKDPPFSRLDLVSCRNLLIYLRRNLQTSVFKLFNYALNDKGYLFLGSSESAEGVHELFRVIHKRHCIYQSSRNASVAVPDLPTMPLALASADFGGMGAASEGPRKAGGQLHRRMLEQHAPPNVIVDENYGIIRLSAGAGRYLLHPAGTPSSNLMEIIRPELQIKLQSALRDAFANGQSAHTARVRVKMDGTEERVRLMVHPSGSDGENDGAALVMFIKAWTSAPLNPDDETSTAVAHEESDAADLRTELQSTKRQLRATIEDHESSKQAMRAANEELRSMNEEYKSMTEELETSKEELQSVNEELKTVNQELEAKVDELYSANEDLENLIAATGIGTLFLDTDLSIRKFTPRIKSLFNIQEGELGRPIGSFTHELAYDELEEDARLVIRDHEPREQEVRSAHDTWHLVRVRPYRSADETVKGVVFTFVDITERKESELELRATSVRLKKRSEQVQRLASALTLAEQGERERLSLILHDDLQQLLFACQMRLDEALKDPAGAPEAVLQEARKHIALAISTTRNLSSELNPPLGKESFRDAIDWLALHMQNSYGLSVAIDAEEPNPPMAKTVHTLLFRTVRELLFNVIKHADVEEAALQLNPMDGHVRVAIADQGTGFDPATLEETNGERGGLGLRSIRERIEMVGGQFSIDSAPGAGTRIVVEIPHGPADVV